METFQDLSLPIPGKEDLAKLHSAIYQNAPAKPGACGDSYTTQGWLAFIVEYIRRSAPTCHRATFLSVLGGTQICSKVGARSPGENRGGGAGRVQELAREG